MYRNISYSNHTKKISLWTWDDKGNRITQEFPFNPYIYLEQQDGATAISIFKTPLVKREFETDYHRKKFINNSGIKRIFYNLTPEQQFLVDRYHGVTDWMSFTKHPLRVYFLDIEVYSPDEFPLASEAKYPINLITIYDKLDDQYYTWGLKKDYHSKLDNVKYTKCFDEQDLLKSFLRHWRKNFPDILTGWNCINRNEHVWLENRIVKLSNVSINDHLFLSDCINSYKETGMKTEYRIETAFGNQILTSKDHKFPVYVKEQSQYKNPNSLIKTTSDMRVHNMIPLMEDNDLYVRIEKRINTNSDITFRDVLTMGLPDNIEIILDSVDLKNKIKKLGLCKSLRPEYYQGINCFKRNPSFWSHKNIECIYDAFDMNQYLSNTTRVYLKINGGHPFWLNLDETIPTSILGLLGFVFTDGTLSGCDDSKLSYYRFSSKYESLAVNYANIAASINNKELSNPTCKNKDKNFYKTININNKIGVLHHLIYNNTKKTLNIPLLSMLSHKQFQSFFSGLMDGDGCIDKTGIALCNFDKCCEHNLHGLQELLLWNNVASTVHKNILRIYASKFNEPFISSLNILHPTRSIRISNLTYQLKTNSISKSLKFFEFETYLIVKITSITETGRTVPMADIETGTHYFTCNGIKTHNCDGYDIPYIVNRLDRLFGEEYSKRLSPVDNVWSVDKLDRFKNPITEWNIDGICCIDFMKAYKKFSRNERESYTLDYISTYELGHGKVDHEGMSIAELADADWNTFVDYNIQDTTLVFELEEKLHYLELCRMIGYKGLTKFEKALGTTNVVAGAFALEARKKSQIIPTFEHSKGHRPPGGWVREPENGFKEAIVSFDAASLYPNTIISLNMSPETKIGKFVSDDTYTIIHTVKGKEFKLKNEDFERWIQEKQVCKSMYDVLFSQAEMGVIPSIIDSIYSDRKTNKNMMLKLQKKQSKLDPDSVEYKENKKKIGELDILQYTLKILMNSIYGTFGNSHSILYDLDIASSITLTGQELNKQAGIAVTNHLRKKYNIDADPIIGGDTDSLFITIKDVLKKLNVELLDDTGEVSKGAMEIIEELGGEENPKQGVITKHINKWAKQKLNSHDTRFEFKREKICDAGLFLESKKRYVLHVLNEEGVKKDSFKYTGIEVVSATIAKESKVIIKHVIENMVTRQDLAVTTDLIIEAYNKFCELPPETLASRKAIRDLDKYAKKASGFAVAKGTPQNSRAAILYNNLINHLRLNKKYEKIKSGDKIKVLYVANNSYGMEYVGFKDKLPLEFGLSPDYDKLYLKIVHPIFERLFESVGWQIVNPTKNYNCDLVSMFS